jgi:hypothetical protein
MIIKRVNLSSNELKGGLTDPNRTQKYLTNYVLPREGMGQDDEKVEFVLITPRKDNNGNIKEFYNSLRFNEPNQIKIPILKLAAAYAFFLKKKGTLNDYTVRSIPNLLYKGIEEEFMKVMKETL